MISSIANLVYELTNDLRVTILGNKEILGKSQIWVETEPSAQSPFQKQNFGKSSQKTCKSRYPTFLALSNFTGFLYLVPNILPRIAVPKLKVHLIPLILRVMLDIFSTF